MVDAKDDSEVGLSDQKYALAKHMPHECPRSDSQSARIAISYKDHDHFGGESDVAAFTRPHANVAVKEPTVDSNFLRAPALPPRPNSRVDTQSPIPPSENNGIDCAETLKEEEDRSDSEMASSALPELEELVCAVCLMPTTSRCSRCRTEGYCGLDHQISDWSRHTNECIALVEAVRVGDDVYDTESPSRPLLPVRSSTRTILVDAILLPADECLPRIVQVSFKVYNNRHEPLDMDRYIGFPSQELLSSESGIARWRANRVRTVHVDWIEHQWKGGSRLDGGSRLSVHFRYDPEAKYDHRCLSKTILGPRIGASLSVAGHSVLKRGDMLVLKHPSISKDFVEDADLSDYVYVGEYYRGLWGA